MVLTPRLLKIAEMVTCDTVADIGTDHAKLPIYLIENGICKSAIASDVADGPISACKKSVAACELTDCIDVRKGDGLETITSGETETIVIAGMGGDLMSRILNAAMDVCVHAKEIILQPMTHIVQLRKFLKENNFKIINEVLVKEKDKIYTIIKVCFGKNIYQKEIDYMISPILISNKDPLLKDYLVRQIDKYTKEYNGLNSSTNKDEENLSHISSIINELEKIYEIAKNY